MTRLTVKIVFDGGEGFGSGKARLLELIGEGASLRKAAAEMKMSYRHAWLLLQAAQAIFGAPLVETAVGGVAGGGSRLTALGREVMRRYRAAEKRAGAAAKDELQALAKLSVPARTPSPTPERRKRGPRKKRPKPA